MVDEEEEVGYFQPVMRYLYGDGFTVITRLAETKRGIVIAMMPDWQPPGTRRPDFMDAVPGTGVTIEMADRDAVDRMISILQQVREDFGPLS